MPSRVPSRNAIETSWSANHASAASVAHAKTKRGDGGRQRSGRGHQSGSGASSETCASQFAPSNGTTACAQRAGVERARVHAVAVGVRARHVERLDPAHRAEQVPATPVLNV
jgi:hypothetical protein